MAPSLEETQECTIPSLRRVLQKKADGICRVPPGILATGELPSCRGEQRRERPIGEK